MGKRRSNLTPKLQAIDDFVSVTAGTLSPVEFFDPGNIGRIVGAGVAT